MNIIRELREREREEGRETFYLTIMADTATTDVDVETSSIPVVALDSNEHAEVLIIDPPAEAEATSSSEVVIEDQSENPVVPTEDTEQEAVTVAMDTEEETPAAPGNKKRPADILTTAEPVAKRLKAPDTPDFDSTSISSPSKDLTSMMTLLKGSGKVKYFNRKKQFGFAYLEEQDSKSKDEEVLVFVHQNVIKNKPGFKGLLDGEQVEFMYSLDDNKKARCTNCTAKVRLSLYIYICV